MLNFSIGNGLKEDAHTFVHYVYGGLKNVLKNLKKPANYKRKASCVNARGSSDERRN